jgi:predicted amidophosphoribosyltransferase
MSLIKAFKSNYDFSDARVLLIDDVCTTGNTLMNCAAALKLAGAQRVSAIVFAKETLETPFDNKDVGD